MELLELGAWNELDFSFLDLKVREEKSELSESSLTKEQMEKHWEKYMKPVMQAFKVIQKEYETILEESSKSRKLLEKAMSDLKWKNKSDLE